MKFSDIKTVDIQTKEWFDKVNGNSYFASVIILNYGMGSEVELFNPFQYGYSSSHEFKAWKTICNYVGVDNFSSSMVYDNKIITRTSKTKSLKRELTAIGK